MNSSVLAGFGGKEAGMHSTGECVDVPFMSKCFVNLLKITSWFPLQCGTLESGSYDSLKNVSFSEFCVCVCVCVCVFVRAAVLTANR